MMIRSAPPASAHFAERPVPAPAPMIGLPAVDLRPQPRERLVARHVTCLDQLVQPVGHRGRERGVVDVLLELVHLDAVERLVQRPRSSACVGLRVVERLPLDRDHRDAAERDEERRRPGRRGELAPDLRPSSRALLRRRAHQRHRRVVHVEVPAVELRSAPSRAARS